MHFTKEEHQAYTFKVLKMSIIAILIPLAAALLAPLIQMNSLFAFFTTLLFTFGLNHWLYAGEEEDNMFIPLAIIAAVLYGVITFSIHLVESRDAMMSNDNGVYHASRLHS
jgi:uncharacterized membrane protein